MSERPISILVADDDPDDRMMIQEAFTENRIANQIAFVEDGEQLMAYLRREGAFAELKETPYPGIILLDLNMPKKDGREALRELQIKNSAESRSLSLRHRKPRKILSVHMAMVSVPLSPSQSASKAWSKQFV